MKTCFVNYGPLLKNNQYNILREGYDFYEVAVNGKVLTVPKFVFYYFKEEVPDESDLDESADY